MGFDISGLRRAALTLSGKTHELNALRASLVAYRSNISAAWTGQDAHQALMAIDQLIRKIDRTNQMISAGAKKMNDAAAVQQIKEASERAAEQMSQI